MTKLDVPLVHGQLRTVRAVSLGSFGFVLVIVGFLAPVSRDHRSAVGPCQPGTNGHLSPSRDLYCLTLVPVPEMEFVAGAVELGRIPSVFTTNVTVDGQHRYEAVLHLKGLPPVETLGDFTTYVAWVTTPNFVPLINLGSVSNGENRLGAIELNKFHVLVSAEVRGGGAEREGRLVLRGASASTRMRPPDLMEFLYGASGSAIDSGMSGMDHAGWPRPLSPAGVTMMSALMELKPPNADPFLLDEPDPPTGKPSEVVRLADGDTLVLEAGVVSRTIGGKTFQMYGFNGQYPGPLIWANQGTTVNVKLVNSIDMPTSVHWHGIRIENRFDGVPGLTQDPVLPGDSFDYRISFPDAGLYWYHPHHREDIQQDLGLYGNMFVQSDREDYFSPANREEFLILDDIAITEEGLLPFGDQQATHALMGRFGNQFLVNGEPEYSLSVRHEEVVRFFLTNVSNTRTFNLSFGGAAIKVVGTDVGNFETEEWAQSVVIAPAERYIVHVMFPRAGTFLLENRVQGIDHRSGGFLPFVDTVGVVAVQSENADPNFSSSFETLRSDSSVTNDIGHYRRYFDDPPGRELILTLETDGLPFVVGRFMQFDSTFFNPVEWAGTMPMMNWASTPDQVRWILRDPSTGRENMEIGWQFERGDVVKIRLSNERETLHAMQHPIHFHGQRFLVVDVNGVRNTNMAWKDTMLLPVGSTADILLDITNPGNWMVHCHIAEHLETGMMTAFTVN